ncbi:MULTISPECIES: MFS transporter [unclassified Nocardioides]|uniref:MFS transporter n=1 Tax=unclassified Nocardioides TaxID=2615069 RepID=UPI000700A3B5|nr:MULTISPECIES: MFS transporter [unclassified Nocardioides]KQY63546.1 MFS transporter [Nocardioides sp. Root140]KRF17503.1 MFS transporter [Nocardioides sp. Soil796]
MSWSASFAPLRETNFRWYFAARFISTTGSMMAPIALAFAVLDVSNTASALGQVLAARSIPLVLFLLIGGVIADRIDRALVMQVSNLVAALTQGIVAWLVISGNAELWQLIVLEAINGTVAAASFPAMASVVPQLVPRNQLQPANVLLSMTRGGLAIIGPSIAALLVVTVGSGWALAVDALTWLIASLCLTRLHIPQRDRSGDAAPNMIRELKEGWSVFTGHTWLWVIVLAFGILNAIHAGAWFTLGPVVAKATIGEKGWGYAVSAEAIGLLLMTVVMLRVSLRFPLRAGMLGMTCFAVPLLMLGVDPHLLPLIGATFIAGAGMEVFGIGWSLAMQENIDEAVLSRAYSYDALGSFVAMPLGQLVYGPLGSWFGYRDVLVFSAIVYAAVALVTLTSKSVRDLERVQLEKVS